MNADKRVLSYLVILVVGVYVTAEGKKKSKTDKTKSKKNKTHHCTG